ncbi:uncharacterized protein LOC131950968 [Physella acuta]|uniref:uncharacterized protein LOC131950968 n=1 Tax=Physella acuta TaxID=109671 RepID=UPI0027DB24D6|nr:uncharacterized protein LOC131950968 [Physella acuta]
MPPHMSQAMMFNLVGTTLIVFALALHIVCLVTPHYSEIDLGHFGAKVSQLIKSMPNSTDSLDFEKLAQGEKGFKLDSIDTDINFGLWEICISGKSGVICKTWADIHDKNVPVGVESEAWLRSSQAMAIIGIILAFVTIIIAIVNVVSRSRGDRLRLIHLFISGGCFFAGFFILVGDLIVAANYKDSLMLPVSLSADHVPQVMVQYFKDQVNLSWGFALDIVAVALMGLAAMAHLMGGRIAKSENDVV